MVNRILSFLSRQNSLNSAAILLASFSFLSQLLAFLRDRLLAHIFGVSTELDVYYAAFRIPDFLFVTVASVVSLSVLIPFIIDKDSHGREELRKFIDSIFTFFALLMIATSVIVFFAMPYLSKILFKGFEPYALERVIFISRVLLLSPVILGISNLFGSITQAYNRFTLYALSPLLYNAGIIGGIMLLGEKLGALGVAIGVISGALLHALIQLPFIIQTGLLPKATFKPDFQTIKKVMKISVPRTLTLSMSALALMFLISFASLMEEGSISILSFSINLSSVPLSLIGVSYSLAAFPTLTRRFQEKNIEAFVEQMRASTRFIIFWSLPLTALLVVLRAQIVRVLLGTGEFGWGATRLTAAALAIFVISSVFQSLLLLFMRGFYSAGHTKKPFFINLFSTILLAAATYALVKIFYFVGGFGTFFASLLKVEDTPGVAVLMLPLGFTIGTIANVVLLWFFFARQFRGFSKGIWRTIFEGLGASVILGTTAYVCLNIFDTLFKVDTLPGIFLQGLASGIIAIVMAALVLIGLKSRELADVWSVLRGKFWKTQVIATDPEIV